MQDADDFPVYEPRRAPSPPVDHQRQRVRDAVRGAVRKALETGKPQPVCDERGRLRFWVVRSSTPLED